MNNSVHHLASHHLASHHRAGDHHRSTAGRTPRVLPWRDAPRQRRRLAATIALIGAACVIPIVRTDAADTPGATLGSLIRSLRDAKSLVVHATFQFRLYKAFDGEVFGSPPADGAPTLGTMLFRDQGTAWRVENEIDGTRMKAFWSVDAAFDGDHTEITNHRCEHRAWMTEAGEYPVLFSQSRNPLFWLSAWTDPDTEHAQLPVTRNALRAIPDALLALADGGWEKSTVEGAAADIRFLAGGPGLLSYTIITPPNQHDRPFLIEACDAEGLLVTQTRFDNWKIPAWGESSALTPRPLPMLVTVIGYMPNGGIQYDVTLSIDSCTVDVPIPDEEMRVSLDDATTLFHLERGVAIW